MEIKVSVRSLVEFILRDGDIDNRIQGSSSDAMSEGSRIHRMIQKKMGPDYRAEVSLKYKLETARYDLIVEGRADGIIDQEKEPEDVVILSGEEGNLSFANEEDQASQVTSELMPIQESDTGKVDWSEVPLIDEIKGTYRELNKLKHPITTHLAQAKCYAFMYLISNRLPFVRVRMTYCNLDTEEIKYFYYHFKYEDIKTWFEKLISQYRKWADFECDWKKIRTESIYELEFPFPYRDGQKDLAANVYRTIVHGKKLFLEAPTGSGKTITTLFPSIKAVGMGKADKIFYLTAKSIAGTVAEQAFDLCRRTQNLRFKTATITAKEKMCFMDECNCNPEYCPYAKGHFDRINDALFDCINAEDCFDRGTIEEYARKHEVCPFEMALDLSLWSDGVVCDYNYVFDPFVYLKRYFADNNSGKYIFLIDEAHNLLDRGRDMYSSQICRDDIGIFGENIQQHHPRIAGLALKAAEKFPCEFEGSSDYKILTSIDSFIVTLDRLSSVISEYLENHKEGPDRDEILQFYFKLFRFLAIYDRCDDKYVKYIKYDEMGRLILSLFNVDPSLNLAENMEKAVSTILFSATMLPIQYYKKLLGGNSDDFEIYAKTVFDPSKCGIFIGSDVTSKYTSRNAGLYMKIAQYIDSVVTAKPGNYMVFFPSHAFLDNVRAAYEEHFFDEKTTMLCIQSDHMDENARNDFLNMFSTGNSLDLGGLINMDIEYEDDRNTIGFCVMGGIFSEGIDLKNDSLIGSIIVGTGIPQICSEREILMNYFENENGSGFDYAYRYPGMNKVLQAAGRVIRTQEDCGVVILLDERFFGSSYRNLFPREWKKWDRVTTDSVKNAVEAFWRTM